MLHTRPIRTTLLAAALLAAASLALPADAAAQETPRATVCYELALANPWPLLLPAHRDTLVLTHEPAGVGNDPDALLAVLATDMDWPGRPDDPPGRYRMTWKPLGPDSLVVGDESGAHGHVLRARRAGAWLEGRATTFLDDVPVELRERSFEGHVVECPTWAVGGGAMNERRR